MNYTKGEWKIYQGTGEQYILAPPDKEKDPEIVIARILRDSRTNPKANAHLIAKSPQMIELIRKLAIQKFVFFPEDRVGATKIIDSLV